MSLNEELGEKLRIIREVHNYTQEYIAKTISVSHNTYSLMEKGKAQFTIDRVEKLINLYNIDIADFLKLSVSKIKNRIKKLSETDMKEMYNNHKDFDEERSFYMETIKRLQDQNESLMKIVKKINVS